MILGRRGFGIYERCCYGRSLAPSVPSAPPVVSNNCEFQFNTEHRDLPAAVVRAQTDNNEDVKMEVLGTEVLVQAGATQQNVEFTMKVNQENGIGMSSNDQSQHPPAEVASDTTIKKLPARDFQPPVSDIETEGPPPGQIAAPHKHHKPSAANRRSSGEIRACGEGDQLATPKRKIQCRAPAGPTRCLDADDLAEVIPIPMTKGERAIPDFPPQAGSPWQDSSQGPAGIHVIHDYLPTEAVSNTSDHEQPARKESEKNHFMDVPLQRLPVQCGRCQGLVSAGNVEKEYPETEIASMSVLEPSGVDQSELRQFELDGIIKNFQEPAAGPHTIQQVLHHHPDVSSCACNTQQVRGDTWIFLPSDEMTSRGDGFAPLTMLLRFLSGLPKKISEHVIHIVVPLALKIEYNLAVKVQKKFTGGVSGHWTVLNFNLRTKQIEFFDPKGDSLESAGTKKKLARPTQFELYPNAAPDSLEELLYRAYCNVKTPTWIGRLEDTWIHSETLRLQPEALVDFLKYLARSQAQMSNRSALLPFDLAWLHGFELSSTPAQRHEKLQFDGVSCPSFTIWFALQRGSEGKDGNLDSFIDYMKTELQRLSGLEGRTSSNSRLVLDHGSALF